MPKKLIILNVSPPIPTKEFDWLAHWDGDDEYPWLHGWGPTREAAMADHARIMQEKAEADDVERHQNIWEDGA